jgi:hypothetical protein
MATLSELHSLFGNNDMLVKVESAIVVAAETIRTEDVGTTNHANRLIWAKAAFTNPRQFRDEMWRAMLGANESASIATILAATDSTIQNNVNAAIDIFADGS